MDPVELLSASGINPSRPEALQTPSTAPSPAPSETFDPPQLPTAFGLPEQAARIGPFRLSKAEQQLMFSTLEAIFQRAEEAEGGVGVGELRSVSSYVDDEGRVSEGRNVEALKDVRGILDQMWWSDSEFMTRAAEVLADGSRDLHWRVPYGEAGILDFFLGVIATKGVGNELMLHSLRLIGNSCADTNANRERVVSKNYLQPIIKQLRNPDLVRIAVPVIYNICVDYEPAQQQAAALGLSHELIYLISDRAFIQGVGKALLGYICRLIDLVVASSPNWTIKSPDNAVEVLFQLATDPELDLDDYLALINVAISHLSEVRFQKYMLEQRSLETPLSILVDSYSRLSAPDDLVPNISGLDISKATPPVEDPEDEKLVSQMRLNLIESLSETSAIPEFGMMYPLESPLIGSLRMWLSLPNIQLQVCACIMLGNLARSDDVCRTMVHDFHIHEPLTAILEESSDPQALHAAIGFLKNLALPKDNKGVLGKGGLLEIVSRLWAMEALPHIQFAGASLARQLVSGSLQNVSRLLSPLSPDPDSPAHVRTYLSLLLSLYQKSDQVPTKTEIARAVTAICRALNSPSQPDLGLDIEDLKNRLFRLHPDVGLPICSMVEQDKWPLVRSEGWFAFALMARHQDGAGVVSHAMHNINVFRPMVEIVTGRKFPLSALKTANDQIFIEASKAAEEAAEFKGKEELAMSEEERKKKTAEEEMTRIDRENALVLINELLKNRGDKMALVRRQVLEDLLHGKALAHVSIQEIVEASKSFSYHEHAPVELPDVDVDPVYNPHRYGRGLGHGQGHGERLVEELEQEAWNAY